MKNIEHIPTDNKPASPISRLVRQTTFVGIALLASSQEAPSQSAKIDSVPMLTHSERGSEWHMNIPGIHHTLFRKGADGNREFNPWFLVSPVQAEVSRTVEDTSEMDFKVPYEYSRLFNIDPKARQVLRPEDYDKLSRYIETEIASRLRNEVHGLGRGVHSLYHGSGEFKNMKVQDISVRGLASPEGPQRGGSSTIGEDNVDSENIALAGTRAEASLNVTREKLQALGIDVSTLPDNMAHISVEEVQFTPEEVSELGVLAERMGGVDELENIYNLIIQYNKGAIDDAHTKGELDRILGSKRGAEVTIRYEGEKTETILLPIPLFLLLIPLLRRRNNESVPKENIPTPPVEPVLGPDIPVGPVIPVPYEFRDAPLPQEGSPEYRHMEEETLVGDMYMFFDNPDSVRRGVDYRQMVIQTESLLDVTEFANDEDRELYLTGIVLRAWRNHDIQARQEAGVGDGVPEEQRQELLTSGLDYEKQHKQIAWARVHARELLRIAHVKRELEKAGKEVDILKDVLAPRVRTHLQNRRFGQK